MNKLKKWFRTPAVTGVALAAAIGLLAFSGIGAARAALNRQSAQYTSEVSLDHIGITLLENGDGVSMRDYSTQEYQENGETVRSGRWLTYESELLKKVPENPVLEKKYEAKWQVRNSGDIKEYVRVNIYRYWMHDEEDKKDVKDRNLSPKMIRLFKDGQNLDEATTLGAWIRDTDPGVDTAAQGGERIVLYYSQALDPKTVTDTFVDEVAISNKIATAVKQTVSGNTRTTTYMYDGYKFCVKVTADAVQTHNAEDAIMSAWGRAVSISGEDGPLSLQ